MTTRQKLQRLGWVDAEGKSVGWNTWRKHHEAQFQAAERERKESPFIKNFIHEVMHETKTAW